jgi:DNA-binding CsgD family transcriptional regulator/PAS domain-containing protein
MSCGAPRLRATAPHRNKGNLDVTEEHLLERFSGTLDKIYGAALSPDQWPSAVEGIADLHGCPQALLLTPSTSPSDGGFVFSHGISESNLQLWGTKYVEHDPWVRAAIEKDAYQEGNVMFSDDLLPREEFLQTDFYRDFLTTMDIWQFCTGIVFDGKAPTLARTACSFFDKRAARPFSEVDKKLHRLTTKHLSRSLATMFRLRDTEFRLAANMAALDRINAGVLLFAPAGNVVFANRAALEILQHEDGLRLRAGNGLVDGLGWLGANSVECETSLKAEIDASVRREPFAIEHFSRGVRVRRPSNKHPYLVQFSTLFPENEFSRADRPVLAIGFVSDPDAVPQVDAGVLRKTFGLSSAEAAVAQEMLSGDALDRVALRMGVSENTVKTQLQSIYGKTGTHRQAQLVKLLMGLASTRA